MPSSPTAIRSFVTLVLLAGAVAASAADAPWTIRGHLPPEKFVIQSHRGAGDLAPENTIEAFELAWKLGTWPEADVRTTSDGVLVSFHDDTFSRSVKDATPDLKKKGVKDVAWDELSKLDVGVAPKGKQPFAFHQVCTIAKVLSAMAGRPDRGLYIDVKNVDLAQLAALVKEHKVERQVILASNKYDLLRKWKTLSPQSGTLYWMGGGEAEIAKRFEDLRKTSFADLTQLQIHVRAKPKADFTAADSFNISDAFLRAAGDELRKHNVTFQTLPWGATDPKVYWKLLDLGVMSFATDRPDVVTDAVRKYHDAAPR